MYTYKTPIRLYHTDSAGVLFFARQLDLVHDAYESFMEAIDFPLTKIIEQSHYALPIVHTEADFHAPIRLGDTLEIGLTVNKVSPSSFTLDYVIQKENQKVGTAQTVHVAISKSEKKRIPLPEDLKTALRIFSSRN